LGRWWSTGYDFLAGVEKLLALHGVPLRVVASAPTRAMEQRMNALADARRSELQKHIRAHHPSPKSTSDPIS
jgi:hypothetical protein